METILHEWPWGILTTTIGVGFAAVYLTQEVTHMEGQHWIMLAVILVAGYVLGRIWTTPAQMIGLP
jgi:hypothetical protein